MASLRVISPSSGKRIEPEWATSFAEELKNSSMGAKRNAKISPMEALAPWRA
jgi:hypothetical protein